MLQYPLWQISEGTAKSNGSLHQNQLANVPVLYWIDLPIEFQFTCESLLHSADYIGQLKYHNDQWKLSEAIHIIDLESMTILNTWNGELNRIRRVLSDAPHWMR